MTDDTTQNQDPNLSQPQQDAPLVLEPLPQAPPLPFHMKASLAEYRKRLGIARYIIAFVISLIILVRFGLVPWLIFMVFVAALVFAILFVLSKRSITLKPDEIEYKGAFGRVSRIRYDEISTAKVFLAYIEAGFGHAPRLIVGSKAGKMFLSVTTLYWKVEDIDLLQAILSSKNVAIETYAEPALSGAIAKQFPQYVSVFERHPYLIAIGVVIAIFIGVIIAVLLLK